MKRYKVRLIPSAQDDIILARTWYRQYNPVLPKHFAKEVNAVIELVRQSPFAHAIRYNTVRIANLKVFPYAVHYIVDENIDTIIVLAVHHSSLSPEKWLGRIK